jgi:hypothetical protein
MDDPCVAADGYTYDRKAIEKWLEENDKSPMTNMVVPHNIASPSCTLLSSMLILRQIVSLSSVAWLKSLVCRSV